MLTTEAHPFKTADMQGFRFVNNYDPAGLYSTKSVRVPDFERAIKEGTAGSHAHGAMHLILHRHATDFFGEHMPNSHSIHGNHFVTSRTWLGGPEQPERYQQQFGREQERSMNLVEVRDGGWTHLLNYSPNISGVLVRILSAAPSSKEIQLSTAQMLRIERFGVKGGQKDTDLYSIWGKDFTHDAPDPRWVQPPFV